MNYLSVCSGIEAATVAWHHLGWKPEAFSEIEAFPSGVLRHHYPQVPNLGDMTKFKEWEIGSIGLLVGGTPCQSFSVAGLRKGLDDPRGNLMLTFGAIASRFRPKWLVWENVPGVLSSNGGRDFGTFLGMLGELGYGFAYRVLDAQFFGVAQRRRRVFVVGHLGDWRRAAAVLFERHSLSGNPAPRREAGKEVAAGAQAGAAIGGTCGSLTARFGGNAMGAPEVDGGLYIPVTHSLRGEGFDASEDGMGRGTPLVPVGFNARQDPISIHPHCIGRAPEAGPQGKEYLLDGSAYCMDSRGQPQAVAFHENQRAEVTLNDTAGSLKVAGGKPGQGYPALLTAMQVRRLTPVECERLQGFPDGYTNIPWRGKPESPDGPRYKALGNSMAVPVMRWIGQRIHAVDQLLGNSDRLK